MAGQLYLHVYHGKCNLAYAQAQAAPSHGAPGPTPRQCAIQFEQQDIPVVDLGEAPCTHRQVNLHAWFCL